MSKSLEIMRKSMRVACLSMGVLTVAGASLAYGSVSVNSSNMDTGASSSNEGTANINSNWELKLENKGDVYNKVDADVDTGKNETNKNTNAGDVETGSIDLAGDFVNELNVDPIDLSGHDWSDVDATFENNTTGAYSSNENTLNLNENSEIRIKNKADIDNKFYLDLKTGKNEMNKNTNAGDLTTGDINVDLTVDNTANNGDLDLAALGSDGDVDVDFTNDTTGYNSDNDNTANINRNSEVRVNNRADIDNRFDVDADTGRNEVNMNTNAGDVTTGGITISFVVHNAAN